MANKNIKKILLKKAEDTFVADIENIESKISQNSSDIVTNNANAVHTTGNESISGVKTFKDTTKMNDVSVSGAISKETTNSCLLLRNGTNNTGAYAVLYGSDHASYPGSFDIGARTDTGTMLKLVGSPNGSLTWDGHSIVRSVNGKLADSSGNVQVEVNASVITGEIKWFAFNTAPDGYLVCNGATVSRTTYTNLFKAISTTYGSGDGSTTFALPNLIDKFAQGSTTVGTYKSAGLPSINHTHSLERTLASYTPSRTLTSGGYTVSDASSGINYTGGIRETLNPIYGKSSTVQPPALTLLPCIKY